MHHHHLWFMLVFLHCSRTLSQFEIGVSFLCTRLYRWKPTVELLLCYLSLKAHADDGVRKHQSMLIGTTQLVRTFLWLRYDLCDLLTSVWDSATH